MYKLRGTFVALPLLKRSEHMELIFYCADPNDFSSRLLNQIRALVPAQELVVCREF